MKVDEKILWIFLVAVMVAILVVIIRVITNKDRIFTYYGEKTKACKHCNQIFVRWDYNIRKKIYNFWIIPDNKAPIDNTCKCHKIINSKYENN